VKYVYVTPGDADTPVNGPAVSARPRKFADEVSWKQRVRDIGYGALTVSASVLLILSGRVADVALSWHPGESKPPAVTTEAPAAYWRQASATTTEAV
jgi:hypothetical protein